MIDDVSLFIVAGILVINYNLVNSYVIYVPRLAETDNENQKGIWKDTKELNVETTASNLITDQELDGTLELSKLLPVYPTCVDGSGKRGVCLMYNLCDSTLSYSYDYHGELLCPNAAEVCCPSDEYSTRGRNGMGTEIETTEVTHKDKANELSTDNWVDNSETEQSTAADLDMYDDSYGDVALALREFFSQPSSDTCADGYGGVCAERHLCDPRFSYIIYNEDNSKVCSSDTEVCCLRKEYSTDI